MASTAGRDGRCGLTGEGHRSGHESSQSPPPSRFSAVEPQKTGGYLHPVISVTQTDAHGHWSLKQTTADWIRIVVAADGYVPRVIGYARFDTGPRWQSYDCRLARGASDLGTGDR